MTTPPIRMVSVPSEPTEAMLKSGLAAYWKAGDDMGSMKTAWSAMLTSAPVREEDGAVTKACADFQEAIDYFEADVADALAEGSERADLWDREVTVNIDALKTVMNAALATREEAPAEAGEREVLFRALRSYNLTNMGCEDDPHIGYPLVDLMSNDGAEITTGEEEMRVLADHLASALRAQPQAREEAQPVRGAALAKAMWGVDLVPATPPAPEAEKLRAAVEALEKIKTGRATVTECSLIARKALSAAAGEAE